MKKKILYSILISGLLLLTFSAFYEINRRSNINELTKITALKIPSKASSIQYRKINANDENLYPYFFYLKFKCKKGYYDNMINGQLFNRFDTGSAKYILRNELLIQDKMFLNPNQKLPGGIYVIILIIRIYSLIFFRTQRLIKLESIQITKVMYFHILTGVFVIFI